MQVIDTANKLVELDFYNEVIWNVSAEFKHSDFDVVTVSDPPDEPFKPLPATPYKKVVFSFSDELNRLPTYADDKDVLVVFKCYAPSTPHPKLCPIPLPYKAGFKPQLVDFARRKNTLFFSGHPNGESRKELQKVCQTIKFDNSAIGFTDGFGLGYKMGEYAAILGNSKYAVCPRGNNMETFRHIEAAMSGCIIISNHQQAHWYNQQVPFFHVNDWTELPAIFEFLENNKPVAEQISKDTLLYYQKYLSLEAVSNVCSKTIKHELTKKCLIYQ